MAGKDTTGYDEAGNRTWYYDSHGVSTPYPDSTYSSGTILGMGSCSNGCETASTSPATYTEWTRSWYGADEKLRFVDRRTCYVFQPDGHPAACNPNKEPMPSARPAFEEYRYDALGRRVLVRSRQHYACTTRCQSTLRRIVWDGDQVLAEIQAPGYTGTSAATMEQDVGFRVAAASTLVPDTSAVPVTTNSTYYPGYYIGRVLYTHGPGIDHPLAMMRMEYSDSLPGPITIYPHENWKGAYDLGSYDGQSLNAPCKIVGYRNGTHTEFQTWVPGPGETSSPPDTLYNCLKVDWPAPHLWLTNRIRENNQVGAESWNGSLIDGMRDATGQMYMRNRYYDPASGRFTQEDPIGIAGGLNVYGFANGDPVTYSDPYGLCPGWLGGDGKTESVEDCTWKDLVNRVANPMAAVHDWQRTAAHGRKIIHDIRVTVKHILTEIIINLPGPTGSPPTPPELDPRNTKLPIELPAPPPNPDGGGAPPKPIPPVVVPPEGGGSEPTAHPEPVNGKPRTPDCRFGHGGICEP
jgi:RHS repeat-associated protein